MSLQAGLSCAGKRGERGQRMKAVLSKKDARFREFSLNAPMGKVVFSVCFPLALYQSLNQLFKLMDTMMASHIGASAVSAVAYLSQINIMLSALGGGLAVGASIKVSEAYGAGDFELVKRRVSTMFAMCALLGGGLFLFLAPVTPWFLRLMNTPEEFIAEGSTYFVLELFGLIITFFNNVYIAIERSRGNSKRILRLNMAVIGAKLCLTALFVYGLQMGIHMIALATILSQSVMLSCAVFYMRQPGNAFGFSLSGISLSKEVVAPMLLLSGPVVMEKAAFSLGKVFINSMSTVYSALTVGALGISNNIGGISTSPQTGFEDGSCAVISQNLGAGQPLRAFQAFGWTIVVNTIVSGILLSLNLIFLDQITGLFAGGDSAFQAMIISIYRYEAMGAIPLGINASVLALLYGFGRTKITLFINFCRVFVFRVPVLWYLQHFTDLGSSSLGIVMAVSNISVGVLACIIGAIEIRRICREYSISFAGMLQPKRA